MVAVILWVPVRVGLGIVPFTSVIDTMGSHRMKRRKSEKKMPIVPVNVPTSMSVGRK